MTYTTQPPTLFDPHIEVRVSKRRKKTAGAHWEGDRIVVVVPAHLRGIERDQMVEVLSRRLARHRPHLHTSDDQLEQRALALGRRYLDGVAPSLKETLNDPDPSVRTQALALLTAGAEAASSSMS